MTRMDKDGPIKTPDPRRPLPETVDGALKDPEMARDVRVMLRVAGGASTQSYHFEFEAWGGGQARCEFRCERRDRESRLDSGPYDPARFHKLLARIRASGVLDLPPQGPPFLPDTVVGCLEIDDGERVSRHYFAADPDQAAVQDRTVPEPLRRAADAVYEEGARLMGLKSVKP